MVQYEMCLLHRLLYMHIISAFLLLTTLIPNECRKPIRVVRRLWYTLYTLGCYINPHCFSGMFHTLQPYAQGHLMNNCPIHNFCLPFMGALATRPLKKTAFVFFMYWCIYISKRYFWVMLQEDKMSKITNSVWTQLLMLTNGMI